MRVQRPTLTVRAARIEKRIGRDKGIDVTARRVRERLARASLRCGR
jgi:hypothetical protein